MDGRDIAAVLLIVAVRGLVPLLLLRWPFWGALLCIAGDAFDTFTIDITGTDVFEGHYHTVDKVFDTYYLTVEAWIVWRRWADPLARRTGLALYALRLAGAIGFELTQIRQFFFVGANIFE